MFEEIKKINISEQITAQILDLVFSEKLKIGDRLPSERQLATKFGTNRNTLREAIKNLETLKIVNIKQGGGIYINDFKKNGTINLLPYFFKHFAGTEEFRQAILDAMELRKAAYLLVFKKSFSELRKNRMEELKNWLSSIEKCIKEKKKKGELIKLDIEFFKIIVDASKSLVYKWLFNTIFEIYESLIDYIQFIWFIPQDYLNNMKSLIHAIEKDQLEKGVEILTAHFDGVDEKLKKLLATQEV